MMGGVNVDISAMQTFEAKGNTKKKKQTLSVSHIQPIFGAQRSIKNWVRTINKILCVFFFEGRDTNG
jgi:hypothetical protein